eukprot:3425391-Rhodomonas_salina.1
MSLSSSRHQSAAVTVTAPPTPPRPRQPQPGHRHTDSRPITIAARHSDSEAQQWGTRAAQLALQSEFAVPQRYHSSAGESLASSC